MPFFQPPLRLDDLQRASTSAGAAPAPPPPSRDSPSPNKKRRVESVPPTLAARRLPASAESARGTSARCACCPLEAAGRPTDPVRPLLQPRTSLAGGRPQIGFGRGAQERNQRSLCRADARRGPSAGHAQAPGRLGGHPAQALASRRRIWLLYPGRSAKELSETLPSPTGADARASGRGGRHHRPVEPRLCPGSRRPPQQQGRRLCYRTLRTRSRRRYRRRIRYWRRRECRRQCGRCGPGWPLRGGGRRRRGGMAGLHRLGRADIQLGRRARRRGRSLASAILAVPGTAAPRGGTVTGDARISGTGGKGARRSRRGSSGGHHRGRRARRQCPAAGAHRSAIVRSFTTTTPCPTAVGERRRRRRPRPDAVSGAFDCTAILDAVPESVEQSHVATPVEHRIPPSLLLRRPA